MERAKTGDGSGRRRGRRRVVRWLGAAGVLLLATATVLVLGRCRSIEVPAGARLATYDVAPYAAALAGSVRDGLVDYAALRRDHATDLATYVEAVGRFGPETTPELFPAEADRLAYYLNAYNAIMLRRWLDAGAGETDGARPAVNRAWFFVDAWRVDGAWISLNTLEQLIIRPRFEEPRIHFALVCGAMSCPPLLGEPFDGERLNAQLEGLGHRWLAEPDGATVRPDGVVEVSRIFKWYAGDFEDMGGVAGVIERYRPGAASPGEIVYQEYDWTINAP
ncbi:MAG: DUF547 domain-containing protein [Planctomycetota bacterium]|jgi:hypothetical protein